MQIFNLIQEHLTGFDGDVGKFLKTKLSQFDVTLSSEPKILKFNFDCKLALTFDQLMSVLKTPTLIGVVSLELDKECKIELKQFNVKLKLDKKIKFSLFSNGLREIDGVGVLMMLNIAIRSVEVVNNEIIVSAMGFKKSFPLPKL